MAPIKNILTSALVLTVAVAAPVELDRKSHAIADPPTGVHSKHHSEPMHKAASSIAGLPSGTFDTKAMQSSALAAAVANAQPSKSADDGIFDVLNHLPLRKERRQFEMLTKVLTELNQDAKRDTVARRQLGAIKSAPEVLSQLARVAALAESLPVKRDEGDESEGDESADLGEVEDWLDSFGKRGGDGVGSNDSDVIGKFLGRLAKREPSELAERDSEGGPLDIITNALGGLAKRGSDDLTERGSPLDLITNALGGLAKREISELAERDSEGGPLDIITNALGGLAKRDGEGKATKHQDYVKHKDALLKSLHGMMENADKVKHKQFQAPAKSDEPNGLDQLAKRQSGLGAGGLGGLGSLLNGLAKRDYPVSPDDGFEKRDNHNGIGNLDAITKVLGGLAKREDMNVENVKRQLGGIATGVLSNVGPAVSRVGKMVTGSVRRADITDDQAEAPAPDATKHKDNSNNDDMIGPESVAEAIAAAEKVAEATENVGSPSNMGPAKGILGKRQLPPIAGGDLPTVVQALAANPSIVTAPLTQGVKVGGTSLGDMFPM